MELFGTNLMVAVPFAAAAEALAAHLAALHALAARHDLNSGEGHVVRCPAESALESGLCQTLHIRTQCHCLIAGRRGS